MGGISPVTQSVMGEGGTWRYPSNHALPYYHYSKIKNLEADLTQYTKIGCDRLFPEGGGDNYGTASGGYDALGFGTLMYAR